MPLADLIAPLSAALANAGEWTEGAHKLTEHSSPPRYVLERVDMTRGSGAQTKSAKALGLLFHRCRVHCWGRDETHAERLMQALETALRESVALSAYEITGASWTADAWVREGSALTVDVTFAVPILPATVGVDGTITDRLPTYVVVERVGFTGGAPGNGVPEAPGT